MKYSPMKWGEGSSRSTLNSWLHWTYHTVTWLCFNSFLSWHTPQIIRCVHFQSKVALDGEYMDLWNYPSAMLPYKDSADGLPQYSNYVTDKLNEKYMFAPKKRLMYKL